MNLDERVEALCAAPTGCAFLLVIEENAIPPAVAARTEVAIHVAAAALNQTDRWRGDHDDKVALALAHGPRLQDLARAILSQPDASWWYAPVDRAAQWAILWPQEEVTSESLVTPSSPPTHWELNAQKPEGAVRTSTAVGNTCAVLAAMEQGAVDHYRIDPPIGRVRVRASAHARVYEIDGPRAWHALAARYPATDDRGALVPDWGLVAAEWDAVHLTLGGMLTADQVRVESEAGWTELTSWPPEQTVWMHWRFEDVARLPDLDEPPPSPVPLEPSDALWIRYDEPPGPWYANLIPTTRVETSLSTVDAGQTEWIRIEDPPQVVPMAVLYPAEAVGAAGALQPGVLVMFHWLVDGDVVARELEPPFPWPPPLRITGDAVRIDLGTGVPPVQVETRILRTLDERGMPVPPLTWSWCRYGSEETGCQIVRDHDDQNWSVALALPDDGETIYGSLRGAWGVPDAPAFEHLPAGTILDAGWLFAVRNR